MLLDVTKVNSDWEIYLFKNRNWKESTAGRDSRTLVSFQISIVGQARHRLYVEIIGSTSKYESWPIGVEILPLFLQLRCPFTFQQPRSDRRIIPWFSRTERFDGKKNHLHWTVHHHRPAWKRNQRQTGVEIIHSWIIAEHVQTHLIFGGFAAVQFDNERVFFRDLGSY